ncbi:MAG: CHRD domain-containing protein [Pseudomonadota bacterium]
MFVAGVPIECGRVNTHYTIGVLAIRNYRDMANIFIKFVTASGWTSGPRAHGIRIARLFGWMVVGSALILSTDLQANTSKTYIADLKHKDEASASTFQGRITLHLNEADETLKFELTVAGVDRVVGSHFHIMRTRTTSDGTHVYLDPKEAEGRIIAFFLKHNSKGVPGNRLVTHGIIRKSELIGEFSERPLEDLIKHLNDGLFYATVHSVENRNSRVICCPIELRGHFRPAGVK